MGFVFKPFLKDIFYCLSILFLLIFGVVVLISIDKPLFPLYFVYIIVAIFFFWFFSQISFDIVSIFSKYFYIGSLVLLFLPLIIGQVTRGTIRWIPIGPFNLQPAEIVRPFLLIFFADYLTRKRVTLTRGLKALLLLFFPVFLILIQPSLGVSILTTVGFVGILLASNFDKKYLLIIGGIVILLGPISWFVMADYQKARLLTFLNPGSDPLGAGYNSIQSEIAAGSGILFGTGLGKGIQTQLAFLPEKQTDFIFAASAEELGFLGAGIILAVSIFILWRLIYYTEHAVSPSARAYLSGFFLVMTLQIFIHVGMNLGMLPVTGVPYPLLSAGGSSLLSTLTGLGIALGAYKR